MKKQTTDEKLKITTQALEKISLPLRWLSEEAERNGAKLDGFMACQIADDPRWLRKIAADALVSISLEGA